VILCLALVNLKIAKRALEADLPDKVFEHPAHLVTVLDVQSKLDYVRGGKTPCSAMQK